MKWILVQVISRGFLFGLLILLTVPGCGKPQAAEEDTLRVLVQIPEGELSGLFWYGVEKKVLLIQADSGLETLEWGPGQTVARKINEGDTLVFQGLDRQGKAVVVGEGRVGKAKLVSILARRVL